MHRIRQRRTSMKTKTTIFIFLFLIFTACSSSKFEYTDVDMEKEETAEENTDTESFAVVSVDKIYCWINLMPGPDQVPRFQITGSISIPNSDNYDLDEVTLKLIKIYQNGNPYFLIKPTIRENKREKSGYSKEFIFSTISGLKLVQGFNRDENVNVEFIFDNDGEMFTYKVTDQPIEKAY